ncbi:MAG: 4Fe-4S binding protein [Bacteroidaceae bacterium]|jgi:2-oxoglutarate ferredoxin oxidoreductase subunit delta|nr:4Fe-4S binding protein [Bacteroidaceae bacterium]MDY6250999.1 4Fe-4S binding protein [Bacteroidaceae bacterium]
MAKIKGEIVVDVNRCKGCNLCVVACPTKTIALTRGEVNHRGYAYCHDVGGACIGCAACATICPDGCISVYKVKLSD